MPLHQQERLPDVEPERGIKRHRTGVEGILDEAHAHGVARTLQGGLHEPPPDPAALHGRVNGDRPDAADRVAFGHEVAADHPPVQLRHHPVDGRGRDEGLGKLRSRLRRREIPGEAVLVRNRPEGLEDDAPAGLRIGGCGGTDLWGHGRLPFSQHLHRIGIGEALHRPPDSRGSAHQAKEIPSQIVMKARELMAPTPMPSACLKVPLMNCP